MSAVILVTSFRDLSVHTNRRTDGHGQIDSASEADQEYIYFMGSETKLIKNIYTLWGRKLPDQVYIFFMGSETLSSAFYILSDESSIPFYSGVTGIKILIYEQL